MLKPFPKPPGPDRPSGLVLREINEWRADMRSQLVIWSALYLVTLIAAAVAIVIVVFKATVNA